jgi:hypothetical protein
MLLRVKGLLAGFRRAEGKRKHIREELMNGI